jgi:hypothetical protein
MTHTSPLPTVEYLDAVAAAVRKAVHSLDQHESDLALLPVPSTNHERLWTNALVRLEDNLRQWQDILASMADEVRATQVELDLLDADLNCSLDMFATARKHLQATSHEAAGGVTA